MAQCWVISLWHELGLEQQNYQFRMVSKRGPGYPSICAGRPRGLQARMTILEQQQQHEGILREVTKWKLKVLELTIAGRRLLALPGMKQSFYGEATQRQRRSVLQQRAGADRQDGGNLMQHAERAGSSSNSVQLLNSRRRWMQTNYMQYKKLVPDEASSRNDGKDAMVHESEVNVSVSGKKPAEMFFTKEDDS